MSGRYDTDRRSLIRWFSVIAGAFAAGVFTSRTATGAEVSSPVPRRALTGRDAASKSVFTSFDVTPNVVEITSNPGLTFYELYSTEGTPSLTGKEPDPMLQKTKAFPPPGGSNFRLISYPPKRPPGWTPPPGVTFESAMKELGDKVPGMADYFEIAMPFPRTLDLKTTEPFGVYAKRIYRLLGMD